MIALIAWGSIWGFMGLILAIPVTGMIKLVFDEIPALEPWGYLLGEDPAPRSAAKARKAVAAAPEPQAKAK